MYLVLFPTIIYYITIFISYINLLFGEKIDHQNIDIIKNAGCEKLPYTINTASYIIVIISLAFLLLYTLKKNSEVFGYRINYFDYGKNNNIFYFLCSLLFSCFVFVQLYIMSEECETILKDLVPNIMILLKYWNYIFMLYMTLFSIVIIFIICLILQLCYEFISTIYYKIIICGCCITVFISYMGLLFVEKIDDLDMYIIKNEGCEMLPNIISIILYIFTRINFGFLVLHIVKIIIEVLGYKINYLGYSKKMNILYFLCSFLFSCFVFVQLYLMNYKCDQILRNLVPNIMLFLKSWNYMFIAYITSFSIVILAVIFAFRKFFCCGEKLPYPS
jgi:hypothetical protein